MLCLEVRQHSTQVGKTCTILSMMDYLINKARVKQRSAIITLLDLKNAFGEFHQNLIKSVIAYHHVSEAMQSLVTSLYTDFHSYIISDGISTPAIPFKRGVLQGDSLSPLLFNMCFNIFIKFVKQEKYNQLGFSLHDETDRLFQPVHWFQFADDAAVITTNERENKSLLNCFSRWCQWACMFIHVNKCITFGTKKFSTASFQFQPRLFINSKIVLPVKNSESYKYLGYFFNFDLDNKDHKEILKPSLQTMLKKWTLRIFIQKISYFCTIATSFPKSLDISQLQIWVRQGF